MKLDLAVVETTRLLLCEEMAIAELESVTKVLMARLEASELKKLPPGSVLDGKRYDKTLYVFERS